MRSIHETSALEERQVVHFEEVSGISTGMMGEGKREAGVFGYRPRNRRNH
jgi:hypothetical protein